MDFRKKLCSRIGMNHIHEINDFVQGSSIRKQKLYDLLFDEDDLVAYNAGWVLTHFSANENIWLSGKQEELIQEVFVCQHTGKRRLLLTILYRQPLTNPLRVDFLNFCLERMMVAEELPWTRALCMKLAYEQCREISELCQELRNMLEMMEPSMLTSSQRGVRQNVLKAMGTGKSLQQF